MKYLDLFSGIGGFALGAYWAGMRFDNHYFSEVDPWAVDLYQKRFPDAIPLGNIKGIDGKTLADTAEPRPENGQNRARRGAPTLAGELERPSTDWILTGGFPCQDISFAGGGAGLDGERSGLWYEMHRIIGELRPRYVIVENVAALFTRGIDAVLGSLAEIGYDAEWETIRASDMGAPHRRERVWIVAYPNEQGESERAGNAGEGRGELAPDVPDANESGLEGRQVQCQCADKRVARSGGMGDTDGSPQVTFTEESRSRDSVSQPSGWTTEPDVGRLAHGVPNRIHRLRGLGNAIVPQIAELIFRQIMEGKCSAQT